MAESDGVENITENLYELLGIDPSTTTLTASEAAQRIADARSRWTKAIQGVKASSIARLNLERLGRIESALTLQVKSADPAADPNEVERQITRQRDEALRRVEARRRAKRDQLKREIEFAGKNGTILEEEIAAWATRYGDVVTEGEMEAWTRPYKRQEQEGIKQRREIEDALRAINEESLFSLVGMPLDASHAAVKQAADALYSEANLRAPRSAEWDIRKNLSGEMGAIANDPVTYQQYSAYVRSQRFYRLYLQPVQVTCDVTHVITAEQVEYLCSLATQKGWTPNQAIEDLLALAQQHGWRVLQPGMDRSEQAHELERNIKEYQRRLAKTRSQVEGTQRERDRALQQLKALRGEQQRLTSERDDALKQVAQARADAKSDSEDAKDAKCRTAQERERAEDLQRRLDALSQRIADGEDELIRKYGPVLATYMSRVELVAAQAILKSFATLPPQWAGDAQRISRDITAAQRLLDEAKRAMPQVERAEALVEEALAKCADLESARDFKATLPPAPPSHVRVAREGDAVALTWDPSSSRDVRYAIVRSIGRPPLSVRDGQRLATVADCFWRDMDAPPARPLRYAIFAERGRTVSIQPALADTELTLLPDVSGVQIEASDAKVVLGWRLPRSAYSVRLVRETSDDQALPFASSDAQSFSLGQASRYEDTGLVNGRHYCYRIYCEYAGLDGTMLRSEGIVASATPSLPPSAVPALTMRGVDGITNHTVHLDAPAPERGSLIIYRTTEAPSITPGATVPVAHLKRLFGFDCREGQAGRDTLPWPGVYVYTPVILFQETALLGEPQPYHYCPAVRHLKPVDDATNGIELRWRWPSIKCDIAEVRYQLVTANSAEPTVILVNREARADEGMCVLRHLPRGEYRISVLARYQFKGEVVYSSEEAVQLFHAAPVRVRYALHTQHGLMGRRYALVLTADHPVALPDIRIVYSHGAIASPSDGRILRIFSPDSPLPTSTWTARLPDLSSEPDAQIGVFPVYAAAGADIVFEPE